MLVLSVTLILASLTMTVLGIVWIVQMARAKEIIQFPMAQLKKEIEFLQSGRYGIYIIGTMHLRITGGFSVGMKDVSTQTSVEVKECKPKYRSKTFKRKMIEFFQFEVISPGKYRIEFDNIDQIRVTTNYSGDSDRYPLVTGEQLDVMIKQTIPSIKKAICILFLCVGLQAFMFGALLMYDVLFH